MKTVYVVRVYNAKHSVTTFKEVQVTEKDGKMFCQNGEALFIGRYEKLSQTKPANGVNIEGLTLLPSFADIKQDIPGYMKFKPKIYHNCQLMVETRGGYLYYWHPVAGKLLIAINSNHWL